MLRINLSTRPFYNERAIHVVLGAVGLAALIVFVAGVGRLLGLWQEHTALTEAAARDEAAAAAVMSETRSIQVEASADELEQVAGAVQAANRLIDQRVFSWTALFNQIERTLPSGVMLTSVRPDVETGEIQVAIGVIGEAVDDIARFINQLEATGAFAEVLAREEELTEDGTYRALLVGRYMDYPAANGDLTVEEAPAL